MSYQPWMDRVKIGDVLQSGSGLLRVVRSVKFRKTGRLNSVSFTIKHCSWTGRCYTVLGYNDLYQCGFKPTRAKRALRSKLDKAITREIFTASSAVSIQTDLL